MTLRFAKYAQIVGHRRSPGPVVKRVRPQGNLVAYSSDVVERAYDNASKADEEVSAVVRRWNDITAEVVAIDPVNRAGAAARAKVLTDLEVLRADTETSLLNAEANDRELIRFMRLELQSTPSLDRSSGVISGAWRAGSERRDLDFRLRE